jgi:predicted enzyme related to lactoylglutathione lyase
MNAVNWFEIPCHDLDRAAKFYERMLGVSLTRTTFMGVPHGIFGGEPNAVGALVLDRQNAPSPQGTLVYLDATGKLDTALARAAEHGGAVLQAKTEIGPNGFIGIVKDTEGNRIGLHSKP